MWNDELLDPKEEKSAMILCKKNIFLFVFLAVSMYSLPAQFALLPITTGYPRPGVGVATSDNYLVTCFNNTVSLWTLTGNLLLTLAKHKDHVNSATMFGKYIVTCSDEHIIKIWSIKGKLLAVFGDLTEHVNSVAMSRNRLVTGSTYGTATLWSLSTKKIIATLFGHRDPIYSVAIVNDRIITGSYDETIKIWDLKKGKLLSTLDGFFCCVALLQKQLLIGSENHTAQIRNLEDGALINEFSGHSGDIYTGVISGGWAATGSTDHTAKIWDVQTGDCLHTLRRTGNVRLIDICSNRVITQSMSGKVKIWNLKTGEEVITLPGIHHSISTSASNLITGSDDNNVQIWDLDRGGLNYILHLNANKSFEKSLAPYRRHVVLESLDGTSTLWCNINSERKAFTLMCALHKRCGRRSKLRRLSPDINI